MGIETIIGAAIAVGSAVMQNKQAKKAADAAKQQNEAMLNASKPAPPPAESKAPAVGYFKRENAGGMGGSSIGSGSFLNADTAPNLGSNSLLGK